MTPTAVTIHNTGNPRSTARNERMWLTNPSNNRIASFHYAVDATEIIECIPPNEVAWHAGNRTGNRTSIGIEICESGDYDGNVRNGARLAAKLLKDIGRTVNDLRQHFDWSRKDCPWKIRRGHGGWTWDAFGSEVERLMNTDGARLTINGRNVNAPVKNVGGRLMIRTRGEMDDVWVEVRPLTEALGGSITWDDATKTARMVIR